MDCHPAAHGNVGIMEDGSCRHAALSAQHIQPNVTITLRTWVTPTDWRDSGHLKTYSGPKKSDAVI
jgi:hypothetical protein